MASANKADLSRITIVPGQPCIRGLRITVWDVLDMLACGMTEDEIPGDYTYLEKADFPTIYAYGADWAGSTFPLKPTYELKPLTLVTSACIPYGIRCGCSSL
jgi:uncharacterized protein (DUF433 family)